MRLHVILVTALAVYAVVGTSFVALLLGVLPFADG